MNFVNFYTIFIITSLIWAFDFLFFPNSELFLIFSISILVIPIGFGLTYVSNRKTLLTSSLLEFRAIYSKSLDFIASIYEIKVEITNILNKLNYLKLSSIFFSTTPYFFSEIYFSTYYINFSNLAVFRSYYSSIFKILFVSAFSSIHRDIEIDESVFDSFFSAKEYIEFGDVNLEYDYDNLFSFNDQDLLVSNLPATSKFESFVGDFIRFYCFGLNSRVSFHYFSSFSSNIFTNLSDNFLLAGLFNQYLFSHDQFDLVPVLFGSGFICHNVSTSIFTNQNF